MGGGTTGEGVNVHVDVGGIELQIANIDRLMTTNPETKKRLQEVIREEILIARNAVVSEIQSKFKNGDPNEARRAIRRITYERILGGNLNILNMKRGTASWSYRQAERSAAGIGQRSGRGGNRRTRTPLTARYQGYEGKARGFILRWVNSGMTKTNPRTIKFKANPNRKADKHNHHPNTGNRGAISAGNFFEPAARSALAAASQRISEMIEQELQKVMDENNN